MAEVTATNYSSPNVVKWATAGSDRFVRSTHLAGWMENLDGHDHDATKGVGVMRLQTTTAPTTAGHVRVNSDEFQWWGGGAGAVQTALRLAGNQTATGTKTFSGGASVANGLTVTTGGFVVSSGGANITGSVTVSNGLTVTAGGFLVSAGGANVSGNVTLNNNLTVSGTLTLPVFGGDTSNAGNTAGLTLNQGAADDEIISFKSSDVSHAATTQTEADTYGYISKVSTSDGGLLLAGIRDTNTVGVLIIGAGPTDNTTKSTAAQGYVAVQGSTISGGLYASAGANANLMIIGTNAGTRFIFDSEGDSHQDVGTAWTNFDRHDDLALLDATAALLDRDPGGLRKSFTDGFLAEHRETLAAQRVVTFNDDGHHFVNWSRFHMLHMGATRYLGDGVAALTKTIEAQADRIAALESRLALGAG